jgi:hypothetical protein
LKEESGAALDVATVAWLLLLMLALLAKGTESLSFLSFERLLSKDDADTTVDRERRTQSADNDKRPKDK